MTKGADKKAESFESGKQWLRWTSIVLIILFVSMVASLNPDFDLNPNFFYWHPFLMSVAILLAAIPGVMIRQMKGRIPTKIHTYMLLLSSAVLCAGYYIIYRHKENHNKPHLVTYHAKVGFAVIVGMVMLSLGSLPTLEPDYRITVQPWLLSLIKSQHKWGGRILLIGAGFCMYTGFDKVVESDVVVYGWGMLLIAAISASVRTPLIKFFSK